MSTSVLSWELCARWRLLTRLNSDLRVQASSPLAAVDASTATATATFSAAMQTAARPEATALAEAGSRRLPSWKHARRKQQQRSQSIHSGVSAAGRRTPWIVVTAMMRQLSAYCDGRGNFASAVSFRLRAAYGVAQRPDSINKAGYGNNKNAQSFSKGASLAGLGHNETLM